MFLVMTKGNSKESFFLLFGRELHSLRAGFSGVTKQLSGGREMRLKALLWVEPKLGALSSGRALAGGDL